MWVKSFGANRDKHFFKETLELLFFGHNLHSWGEYFGCNLSRGKTKKDIFGRDLPSPEFWYLWTEINNFLTKGVQPLLSWLIASTSLSSIKDEFSVLQCSRVQTRRENPKAAAKWSNVRSEHVVVRIGETSSCLVQLPVMNFWQSVTNRSSKDFCSSFAFCKNK